MAGFAIRRRREKSLLGAIMVTTGAKEPSHTLPAEVDVTHAPNEPGLTDPNHHPVAPASGVNDGESRCGFAVAEARAVYVRLPQTCVPIRLEKC